MGSRNYLSAPAENWDDDFEFSQTNGRATMQIAHAITEPRLSVASSHFSESWDAEGSPVTRPSVMTLLKDRNHPSEAGLRTQLQDWAEMGPSTPTKRFVTQAENWDDDFEDKMDSPAQRQSISQKTRTPSRHKAPADHEDWDEDFEYAEKNTSPVSKRSRQDAYADSSDDEGEFGFGDKEEEDRTVTTRSRSLLHRQSSPPPPVPALPQGLHNAVEPFPRSPSVSVFSIPTTSGRGSVGYMSTSHLALRPSVSGPSLAMLPPSPPIHRERRRLRKKSRPPNLDNNVFELMEEQRDSTPPLPPSTPERSSPPPPPTAEATPSSNKTPLLSRIGSVKKWGARRKRASTGPAEVVAHQAGGDYEQEGTPRPPSTFAAAPSTSSGSNTRSGWFFRPGGAPGSGSPPPPPPAELKYEKSQDNLITVFSSGSRMDATVPSTPSKSSRKKLGRTFDPNSNSGMVESSSSKPSLTANVRRPTSMQGPNGKFPVSSGTGPRHASYGSSTGRAAARVFSTPTPTESSEELHVQAQEGSRNFIGNVRKISFVGPKKHKKKKSTADVVPLPPLPTSSYHQDERTQSPQGDTRISGLLPPIELQPPSPPRPINRKASSQSPSQNISDGLESLIIPSSSLPISFTPRSSPMTTSRSSPKAPSSPPQSASLGRTTQAPTPNPPVPRRNSLGDLKIPARISQAQFGLKRDLGMVREFAASVDKLRELRSTYEQLLSEANSKLEDARPPSRATSPTILSLARTRSRLRSNTNPNSAVSEHRQFANSLQALNNKYKIPWECAELLIELGNGSQPVANPPATNPSATPSQGDGDIRKGRERAITLSGEESKLPPTNVGGSSSGPRNPSWRASTGRHDLSQRQLVLLRDMLNNTESMPDYIPPEDTGVNRQWRWGDAMSSTVTLPSEDSAAGSTERKKRRMSRLRDMLRMLKRGHSEQPPPLPPPPPPIPPSTTSLSTESSLGSYSQHHYPHGQVPRRGSKTSTGPDLICPVRDQQNSPYGSPPLNHKASPRRPSLASIFRIGQKNKSTSSTGESSRDGHSDARSASRSSNMTNEDDWDRIDSAVDLDVVAHSLGVDGTATIKGRKLRLPYPYPSEQRASLRPVTPVRGPESSQTSLRIEASPRSIRPMRSIRLSNVEEAEDEPRHPRLKSKASSKSSLPKTNSRPPSRGQAMLAAVMKSGSVRSAPPQPLDADGQIPDFKLSMTPENIRPLLENAKEVHARLNDCIKEMRTLLDTYVSTAF
ncbi:hypothetical protein EDC04DRAFT_758818 [Pisolithus marmoratus]|nr:hypothetical protein EDC04DRAFT_758818 [Pisolithus marmoratus]